jgi:ribosome-associated toxin RatA of RatAB toxin-antitoxin module
MYDLVNDIESYPAFLPWCRSSAVLYRDEDQVKAELELAKGKVHKRFTTVNRLRENSFIEVRLVEGPFSHLQGVWTFAGIKALGCRVSLDLEFDFSSRVLATAVGPVFAQIANTLVDSFHKRASEIYDPGNSLV